VIIIWIKCEKVLCQVKELCVSSLLVLSPLFSSGLLDLMKSASTNKRRFLLIAVFQ
jgi:hypothetical protein